MLALRPGQSFRAQLILLVSAVTALGVIALTIVVQVVLEQSATSSIDSVLRDRADRVIAAVSTDADGRLTVPDEQLAAGVAVYDGAGRPAAGSAPSADEAAYARLATTRATRIVDVPSVDDERRILAEPFTTPSGARGVVVVIERFAPYERAELQALWVSIGAGALMILLAASLAAWVSRRTLAPVVAMSRAADDWSEHDLSHRFGLGPGTQELTALGGTLDRLLDRVATAIRSEQRLTSELAHELRTPLAAVLANADLLRDRGDVPDDVREGVEEIGIAARRMGSTIDDLLHLARSRSMSTGDSCYLAEAVHEAVDTLSRASRTPVRVDIDPTLRVSVPPGLAVRAISPILDNAIRLAATVQVSTGFDQTGFIDLRVDDDGPGVDPSRRDAVFEPGETSGGGSGLGLALVRRVARTVGGEAFVGEGPLRTRFVLRLPLVPAGPKDRTG